MAKMPAFSLPDPAGTIWTAKGLRGHAYVLYFYPKDNTPGCTTEAREFSNHVRQFLYAGAIILGVSPDSPDSHQRFICKQKLDFILLSDTDKALAKACKVYGDKMMYGKKVKGIIRSTFLVGADGTILREWRGVRVKGHVAEVLAAAEELIPKKPRPSSPPR